MGKNASGQTHYLSLSGLEIYGTISGVCEDQLGKSLLVGSLEVSLWGVCPCHFCLLFGGLSSRHCCQETVKTHKYF